MSDRRRVLLFFILAATCLLPWIGPATALGAGILFSLIVFGIFTARTDVLLRLMSLALLLLSPNCHGFARSAHLGDLSGQVFVFFILTVAAAESAIGLAILVVLFRQRRSINVEDLDAMRG